MDAIKLIGTSHNGKLVVDVPEEYDEKELEILIVSSKDTANKKEVETKRNITEMMKIAGAAKYPEISITK